MKTAGVAIDLWKKEIFVKWFIDKELEFEIHETPHPELLIFRVKYEKLNDLVNAIEFATRDCSRHKKLNQS